MRENPKAGGNAHDKLFNLFHNNDAPKPTNEEEFPPTPTLPQSNTTSVVSSPYNMSPWNNQAAGSPYVKSLWQQNSAAIAPISEEPSAGLIGSLIREQGHIYSLATAGDLLYTGSDSKNIRVWKQLAEFSGFKSGSGLVKAIVISGEKIFTGHQDGKIRIWKASRKDSSVYQRVGSLPGLKDFLTSSINPWGYVKAGRHRSAVWLRHFDAVSSLALDVNAGILYSGSWDKTFKVWRISDSKCLESVTAHEDAMNAVAVGFDGLVFTGSADGTVKVWERELGRKNCSKHVLKKILMQQESAVTALAVSMDAGLVYCGSSDGTVNFWEERGRQFVHGGVLRGHKLAVLCLVTPGSLVISGSADRTIHVWRREEGGAHASLSVLTGHSGPIKCLAVGDDGGGPWGPRWVLYSGSLDKSVKVWRVSERTAVPHVTKSRLHVSNDAGMT